MDKYFNKGKLNFNEICNLRRDAFVDVLTRSSLGEKILGIFANSYDEVEIRAYGLIPIPLQGLDSGIFKFGSHPGCDLIKSTLVYLKTDKCPILHSTIAYVFDKTCMKIHEEFKPHTDKPIYISGLSQMTFSEFCKGIAGQYSLELANGAKKILGEIKNIQKELEKTVISGVNLMHLDFYSKFILDLDKRLEFFQKIQAYPYEKINKTRYEVKAICPWAIGFEIEKLISQDHYKIVVADDHAEFGLDKCIKDSVTRLNY